MDTTERLNDFCLEQIQVATPCRANWADMKGDDRIRLCGQCEMHVYNLAEMTTDEVSDLVRAREKGRVCIRMYRRHDGTVVTKDCPIGLRAARHRLLRTGVAIGVVLGVMVLAPLVALASPLRLLGKHDPLGNVRAWLKPKVTLAPLAIQVAPHQLPNPAMMGDMAIVLPPAAQVPANTPPKATPQQAAPQQQVK